MVKPEIIGLVGMLLLALITAPFYFMTSGGSGTSDGNDLVKVTSNDTNADYLFSKLTAGSNITLSVLNPGGVETVQINASGTGSSGTCDNNINCHLTSKFDINGPALTLTKDPSFGTFTLGDSNILAQIPVKTSCIFSAPLVPGCNGLEFFVADPNFGNSIGLTLVGNPSFLALLGFTNVNGVFWGAPGAQPTAGDLPASLRGSAYKTLKASDGNFLTKIEDDGNWTQVGLHQSNDVPDFNLKRGTIRGDLNITNFVGNSVQLRFKDNNSAIGTDLNFQNNRFKIQVNDTNADFNLAMAINGTQLKPAFTIRGSDGFTALPNLTQRAVAGQAVHWNSNNGNIYALTSDSSYKSDIQDLNLVFNTSLLWDLKPRAYKEKATGIQTFGLIAEEVQETAPYLAILNDVDSPYDSVKNPVVSVNYLQLSVVQLSEMKRLRQSVIDLNAVVVSQGKEIAELKLIVCSLVPTNPLCLG